MCARFSPHNKWVVSVGGKDWAIFQWRVQPDSKTPPVNLAVAAPEVYVYQAPKKRLVEDLPDVAQPQVRRDFQELSVLTRAGPAICVNCPGKLSACRDNTTTACYVQAAEASVVKGPMKAGAPLAKVAYEVVVVTSDIR